MSRILPWLASRVRFLIFPSYFRRVLHDVSKVSRHQSSLGLGLLQKYRLEFITVFYFFRGFELNQSDIFNHTVIGEFWICRKDDSKFKGRIAGGNENRSTGTLTKSLRSFGEFLRDTAAVTTR